MQVKKFIKLLPVIIIVFSSLFFCYQITSANTTTNIKVASSSTIKQAPFKNDATSNNFNTGDSQIYNPVEITSDANFQESRVSDANNYFVKIGEQIVPIDYSFFSSKETFVKYVPDSKYYPEIENINLCPDDKFSTFTVCDKITLLHNRLHLRKEIVFKINKDQLAAYLEILNKSSKKSAKNAILTANTTGEITVLKKEEKGYEIDTEKIMNNPLEYFNPSSTKKISTLPVKITLPKITSFNYEDLGLKEKIGSGMSNFRGSPKNRIHNIHNATSKFEGILIPPGEVFSFVENLGDVNESTGYKEELVIKNNKTFPEFGGGICQVSTTLFRSAVNTGLEITERRNHAYPVQYYSPQGTDATIYIPKPDLQFKNNTAKYIMLQPHIEGTILTFDIFGTSDGRQVRTEGPTLLKRGDDGSRKYVWWQIVNDKDGNQISKKGFWSYYQDAAKFHSNHQEQRLTSKPKNWSGKQWKQYKKTHGI